MRRGKWIQCQWEQVLKGKQWYIRGWTERAVNLFSDSGLTAISDSLDCCYQSVEQGGRVPSSSWSQSCWMGSTWASLWMDLCQSAEILIYSFLGCSGEIFLFLCATCFALFFLCILQKKSGTLHIYCKNLLCFTWELWNLLALLHSVSHCRGNQNAFSFLLLSFIDYICIFIPDGVFSNATIDQN